MPSASYGLFRKAIKGRKQVVCTYQGKRREVCPIILGYGKGEEKVLAYQFAGQSSRGLRGADRWRCMFLSGVTDVQLRDGPWFTGESHLTKQVCVDDVRYDVNPNSPYIPKRRRSR